MHRHSGDTVVCSAGQVAQSLWKYGEDALVPRAARMSRPDLEHLWLIAGDLWAVDHGLPLTTRLTSDKVIAFAAIVLFERAVRPLASDRRRPAKTMPPELAAAEPLEPVADLGISNWRSGPRCLPRRAWFVAK